MAAELSFSQIPVGSLLCTRGSSALDCEEMGTTRASVKKKGR